MIPAALPRPDFNIHRDIPPALASWSQGHGEPGLSARVALGHAGAVANDGEGAFDLIRPWDEHRQDMQRLGGHHQLSVSQAASNPPKKTAPSWDLLRCQDSHLGLWNASRLPTVRCPSAVSPVMTIWVAQAEGRIHPKALAARGAVLQLGRACVHRSSSDLNQGCLQWPPFVKEQRSLWLPPHGGHASHAASALPWRGGQRRSLFYVNPRRDTSAALEAR